MAQTSLSVRIGTEDKKLFEYFCEQTGLNVSVAINMFIKAVIREQKIPFEVKVTNKDEMSCFSPKLLKAMAEAKEISNDPNVKSYTNMEELKKALEE